ncbi:MAG: diheme cytochrome c [Thiobacillaceae bacterium]
MKSSQIRTRHFLLPGLIAAGAGLLTPPAQAAGYRITINNRALQQECGSCHVIYPPQLLSAASWRAVMNGLDRHFGADASVDSATREEILRYLQANASRKDASSAGKPSLRITDTRWFIQEHSEELPHAIWSSPAVKSPSNCSVCHAAAGRGDYSERTLHVPGGKKR